MKNWIKTLLGLIVIAIVAVALICYFTADKPVDYVKATPEFIIKAKRLYNDYALNPDLADEKYTGKIIQLNGRISEVVLTDSVVTLVYTYHERGYPGHYDASIQQGSNASEQGKAVADQRALHRI